MKRSDIYWLLHGRAGRELCTARVLCGTVCAGGEAGQEAELARRGSWHSHISQPGRQAETSIGGSSRMSLTPTPYCHIFVVVISFLVLSCGPLLIIYVTPTSAVTNSAPWNFSILSERF